MNACRRWSVTVASILLVIVAGCAVKSHGKLSREEQQALVRSLTDDCGQGVRGACAEADEQKQVLYNIYGCHCKDSRPSNHKAVW